MKSTLRLAVCLLLTLSVVPTWGQRSSYDPAIRQASKQRDSFAEFALKQINPQNTDYGCEVDETRKLAIHETVENINSWSVLIAFSFLVLSFFMLLHQHRERNRREFISAEFLTQYHNAWVDARNQAENTILRYNDLVNEKNRSAVAGVRSPDSERAQESALQPNTSRSARQQSPSSPATANNTNHGDNGASRAESGREVKSRVSHSEANLIAQISTLQQQLNASHEREKQLQKQISKSQRRVPAQPETQTSKADVQPHRKDQGSYVRQCSTGRTASENGAIVQTLPEEW